MDLQPIFSILPPELSSAAARLDTSRLEELRLRTGQIPAALVCGQERSPAARSR